MKMEIAADHTCHSQTHLNHQLNCSNSNCRRSVCHTPTDDLNIYPLLMGDICTQLPAIHINSAAPQAAPLLIPRITLWLSQVRTGKTASLVTRWHLCPQPDVSWSEGPFVLSFADRTVARVRLPSHVRSPANTASESHRVLTRVRHAPIVNLVLEAMQPP